MLEALIDLAMVLTGFVAFCFTVILVLLIFGDDKNGKL